jgi:hypothetical protein
MICIRAHHLLCIPRFYRGGYNERFACNMKAICSRIRNDPDTSVRAVVGKLDDLCMECPHRYEGRCVQSERIGKWVVEQDKKVSRHLGIKPGSVHKARDIFNLSMDKVGREDVRQVCKGCIFMENCAKVGINNAFRKDLNKKAR